MSHLVACVVVALACAGSSPDEPDPSATPSAAPSSPAAASADAPSPAATPAAGPATTDAPEGPSALGDPVTAMQGDWAILLGDEERRQLMLLELALQDPPATEQELAAAGLSAEERTMVGLLASARARSPEDPKVQEVESAVANLRDATLRITDRDFIFSAGPVRRHATYTVGRVDGAVVTVHSTDDDGTRDTTVLTLEGPDVLLLRDAANPGRTQRFVRRR